MLGAVLDTETTAPQALSNMAPVANGSVSTNQSQTYEKIQFTGDGLTRGGFLLIITPCRISIRLLPMLGTSMTT